MDGIHRVLGGFKNDYPKIEKALDQPKDKPKDEQQRNKKKRNQQTNALFEDLASSLGQYSEDPYGFHG